MELYDKDYFKKLIVAVKKIDRKELLRKWSFFLIAVLFFFAWVHISSKFSALQHITDVILMIAMVIAPFLLLISVIQYRNAIAYTVVLGIFYYALLVALNVLWHYVNLYQEEMNGNFIDCSCSPSHELKDKLKLVCMISFAIVLMSNRIVQSKFRLERRKWISILLAACLLYFLTFYKWY